MPSSRQRRAVPVVVALLAYASRAQAQPAAQGFAVERLYRSAPGAGWVVMDTLDMRGALGGAVGLTVGYARNPLRISDGTRSLAVVSGQAFASVALAVTYDRLRFSLDLDAPFFVHGDSGTLGGYAFTAPTVDPSTHPDTLSDVRVGVDARLVGAPGDRFRFGAGAQLFVPFGTRDEYHTDTEFRGMVRALVAGDVGRVTDAAQLGVHVRTLDDTPTPGSPRGPEAVFGVAAGARIPVGPGGRYAVVVGPEVFGASAFRSFLGAAGTELEGLLSGRFEGTAESGAQVRVKLGAGLGVAQGLGAPDWRLVVGVELFNRGRNPR